MSPRAKAVVVALAAVAGLWLWQFATVESNYGGNWTALFRIRANFPRPDSLESDSLYLFENGEGYDGQVYHLIAHDPWMRKGWGEGIVGAPFRYQRIFVPALAWAIALGRDAWIDRAYFGVILGFGFLGVYWLARIAMRAGFDAAWGWAFVLAPATMVSIDRMTVDIALAALVCAFVWMAGKAPMWRVAVVLGCAALTRETGLLIIAGYAAWLMTGRRFRDAAWAAISAAPALAWFAYLSTVGSSPVISYASWIPFGGFIERVVHPARYSGAAWKTVVALGCDDVALAGVAIVFVVVARMALARRWEAQTAALYALTLAAVFIGSRSVWEEADAFGRVLTPMLLLAALESFARRPWLAFAPVVMVDSPIALTLWQQATGVAHHVAHGVALLK
jgi:hypothetical protein